MEGHKCPTASPLTHVSHKHKGHTAGRVEGVSTQAHRLSNPLFTVDPTTGTSITFCRGEAGVRQCRAGGENLAYWLSRNQTSKVSYLGSLAELQSGKQRQLPTTRLQNALACTSYTLPCHRRHCEHSRTQLLGLCIQRDAHGLSSLPTHTHSNLLRHALRRYNTKSVFYQLGVPPTGSRIPMQRRRRS